MKCVFVINYTNSIASNSFFEKDVFAIVLAATLDRQQIRVEWYSCFLVVATCFQKQAY